MDGMNALGDVILVPGKDKNGAYAFELMIRADGMSAEGCNDPKNSPSCIVARRAIHFTQYQTIDIRVDLRSSCLGVICPTDETCVRGSCVNATLSACTAGCDEGKLVPNAVRSHLHRIASGATHTCAITPAGGVKCWGQNEHGELGNNTNTDSAAPVDVQNLGTTVISLAASQASTCALLSTRAVKCWGKNDYGQLGNGTTGDAKLPVDVSGVASVTSIAAGCKHFCASQDGLAKCWGWNDKGQLGDASMNSRSTAVDANGATDILFVTAGFHTSCAGTQSSGALCWGDDALGELGDGLTAARSVPGKVPQLHFTPVLMAQGAHHSVAAGLDGGNWVFTAWGMNPNTGGMSGALDDISAGENYTCILQNSAVSCLGQNDRGQLGLGNVGAPTATIAKVALANVVEMAAGFSQACAKTLDGKIHCWGANDHGQLGDGTTTDRNAPATVVDFP